MNAGTPRKDRFCQLSMAPLQRFEGAQAQYLQEPGPIKQLLIAIVADVRLTWGATLGDWLFSHSHRNTSQSMTSVKRSYFPLYNRRSWPGLQIKLSTKSFGRDAAEVAAKGIANIASTLVEADLSDIIAGAHRQSATCAIVENVFIPCKR